MPRKESLNTESTKVPIIMGYSNWRDFLDYCRTISCIAERLIWERIKDADEDTVKAYKTTDEYKDLKKLVMVHQLPQISPHNLSFREMKYRGAIESLWTYVETKLYVTKPGIDMIQREYEKFLDQAKQAGQRRREQKAKIKTQFQKIGG